MPMVASGAYCNTEQLSNFKQLQDIILIIYYSKCICVCGTGLLLFVMGYKHYTFCIMCGMLIWNGRQLLRLLHAGFCVDQIRVGTGFEDVIRGVKYRSVIMGMGSGDVHQEWLLSQAWYYCHELFTYRDILMWMSLFLNSESRFNS